MSLVLFILYISIIIFFVVYFIKCLKKKASWKNLFIYEILSIALASILFFYYNNLPGDGFMPGLTYIGEILCSYIAMIVYIVLFIVTMVIKITLILVKKKKEGKNYFPIIFFTVAIAALLYGTYSLFLDIKNDIRIESTVATIVGYEENKYNSLCPVVEYTVDNHTYRDLVEVNTVQIINSTKLYDKIEITYNKYIPSQLANTSGYEIIYIPCFILSIIIMGILFFTSRNKKAL